MTRLHDLITAVDAADDEAFRCFDLWHRASSKGWPAKELGDRWTAALERAERLEEELRAEAKRCQPGLAKVIPIGDRR
jgi:hypothetical protein